MYFIVIVMQNFDFAYPTKRYNFLQVYLQLVEELRRVRTVLA